MRFLDKLLVRLRITACAEAMAARHSTVCFEAKDFASAFLDPSKNSRGYDGKLLEIDKNMVKSLLRPFPFVPSGFRHSLGSRMQSFVEGQLGLSREHCENGGQELKTEHGGKIRNDHQGGGQAEEEPDDTINIISKCPKVEEFGSSLGGNFTDLSFSYNDRKTRIEELGSGCATDRTLLEDEVILDSQSFIAAIPSSSSAPVELECELENTHCSSTAEISVRQDTVKPQQNTGIQPEQTLPLSLFKNLAAKQESPMDLSDLTMKIKLKAITSVLENKYRPITDDLNVSGIVALLYGSYTGDSTVSVHSSDTRGVYNYIDGTVKLSLDAENEGSNLVDLTLFLSLEMSKAHCTLGCETGLHKDRAVAWCISSPGVGIDLDWQVHEKLTKLFTDYCDVKTDDPVLDPAYAWCTVLVVVDEYRCAEKDVPLIEVYQLKSGAAVKVVNFDFQ